VTPRFGAGSLLALLLVPSGGGEAQRVLTQDEALRMAFPPPAEIERRTAFLERAQMERAEELAAPAVEVEEPIVTHYVGREEDGRPLGVAYFDAHRVRTLPEVLMVVVTPGGEVARVEVLKFNEPQEYRPPDGWLEEFEGKDLSRRISTSGSIINITGATLTSRAVSRAVRKVLALHRVIDPLEKESGGSGGSAGADTGAEGRRSGSAGSSDARSGRGAAPARAAGRPARRGPRR